MDKDICYSTLLLSGFISQDHFIVSLWIKTHLLFDITVIGFHITRPRPFHCLLMDKDHCYSTLLEAFPKLHKEMLSIPASDILTTKKQVFHFVTKDIFERTNTSILHRRVCPRNYLAGQNSSKNVC